MDFPRGICMVFLAMLFLSVLEDSSSAELTRGQMRCFVNKTWYEEGDKFPHWFRSSPCRFECTCVIKQIEHSWVPTGSCVHRCPEFKYPPYGCKPVSNGCCATSYVCEDGEKCKNDKTGMLYGIGESWQLNDTCTCTCFGEEMGKYQCRCLKQAPSKILNADEDKKQGFENPCLPDDSQSCTACPIGMITCPIRAKCEKWPYEVQGIHLQCTCYGKKGTRCVSKSREDIERERQQEEATKDAAKSKIKADEDGEKEEGGNNGEDDGEGKNKEIEEEYENEEKRSKRSIAYALYAIYFSEGVTKRVEPSLTGIYADL